MDLAIQRSPMSDGSGVVGQKLQGLRSEWAGRMGDRVSTLPRAGVWREGESLSKGKEFVTNKIPLGGLAAGRDPGRANVLFCVHVWEGLGRTQLPGAVLFVELEWKLILGASKGNCPKRRPRLCGWVFPALHLVSLIH